MTDTLLPVELRLPAPLPGLQVREVRFVKQETLRRIDATLSYVESDGTRSLRVGKQGS